MTDDSTPGVASAPTFDPADCYGIVGDYVRLMLPHTEAHPAAIYAALLAACGALIGRGPTWHFGDADHHARLFVLIVGPTGAGRKGTALGVGIKRPLDDVDPDFKRERMASGLSSAEGLIAEVRDPIPDREIGGKVIPGDPGVPDKRLLVVEGELGGALEAMGREGNRLSAILRDAWDGADLRSMVKRDPQRATAPHVCVVGAITATELQHLLTKNAVQNGLANRFLPIYAARTQLLADDSRPDPTTRAALLRELAARITHARTIGRVAWTPAALARWDAGKVYQSVAVTPDPSPVVRALHERAAPMVRRLAMLLALLDGTGNVDVPHLEAALALWRYASGTWRFIYHKGETFSPHATRLLTALADAGSAGLTRTEIRERLFPSGDTTAQAITDALRELATAGLAERRMERTFGASGRHGRPRERWHHARHLPRMTPQQPQQPQLSTAGPFIPAVPAVPAPPVRGDAWEGDPSDGAVIPAVPAVPAGSGASSAPPGLTTVDDGYLASLLADAPSGDPFGLKDAS